MTPTTHGRSAATIAPSSNGNWLRSSWLCASAILASMLSAGIARAQPLADSPPDLPSAPDHFETYRTKAISTLSRVVPRLDPNLQVKLAGAVSDASSLSALSEADIGQLLETVDRGAERTALLDVFLHESMVLEILPPSQTLRALAHDCLLLFLHLSSDERQAERFATMARLPDEASRGDRILAFMARTPTLQKLGQILARNPSLAPDVRVALQSLENSIATSSPGELEMIVRSEWARDAHYADCHAEFGTRVLAEASVGAVIEVRLARGDAPRAVAVSKILKPYAVKNLGEELEILSKIVAYLGDSGGAYGLGAASLSELFVEVRDALAQEIRVTEEQSNLRRAKTYFEADPSVVTPEVLDCSTTNATFMDFIEGIKITDAYPALPDKRRRVAERLSDVMTYDVLFSKAPQALFHGDPHAGNVLVSPSSEDPYRLGLIDWGLAATLERPQRIGLIQLILGLYLNDRERLAENIDALVHLDGGAVGVETASEPALGKEVKPESSDGAGVEDRDPLDRIIDGVLEGDDDPSLFESLQRLVTALTREGYLLRYNVALYVKSQVTMEGILYELDPEFRQDKRVMSRVTARALREFPKRLGRTVWFPSWHSRDYGSLLSNEDVKDVQWFRIKRAFGWLGRGLWRVISAPVRVWKRAESARKMRVEFGYVLTADAVLEQIFLHAIPEQVARVDPEAL